MSEHSHIGPPEQSVEDMLREEVAHGDVVLSTARPILRHLLANDAHAMFCDEVLARVRGMMASLARQMLVALAGEAKSADVTAFVDERCDELTLRLLGDTQLLTHVHALTVEARTAEKIRERSGIDPVLTPLFQELSASTDGAVAASGMRALAAQARFIQQQHRMDLPLGELPEDLFSLAIAHFRSSVEDEREAANAVVGSLRDGYRPGARRVAQMKELIAGMKQRAVRSLDIHHAGVSLFVTALAMATDEARDTAILSLSENQCARLALSLRASGLSGAAVEEQFLYLHPDIALPEGFGAISAQRANAILTEARRNAQAL